MVPSYCNNSVLLLKRRYGTVGGPCTVLMYCYNSVPLWIQRYGILAQQEQNSIPQFNHCAQSQSHWWKTMANDEHMDNIVLLLTMRWQLGRKEGKWWWNASSINSNWRKNHCGKWQISEYQETSTDFPVLNTIITTTIHTHIQTYIHQALLQNCTRVSLLMRRYGAVGW